MQLNVAVPLGALLLLEIAIATAKSLREGNLAFLFPRLSSSETGLIARQLEHLIEVGDRKRIRELLVTTDMFQNASNISLEDPEEIERQLVVQYEETYDAFLNYMPEKLKEFLESWKILRDYANLKVIIKCQIQGIPPEVLLHFLGPRGKLTNEVLMKLAETSRIETTVRNFELLFPEVTSRIGLEGRNSLEEFEVAIDRSASQFIVEKCSRMKIEKAEAIKRVVISKFEIEDIINMARLKAVNTPIEKIKQLLLGQTWDLDEYRIESLASAENYESFYSTLLGTKYGTQLPRTTLEPARLREELFAAFLKQLVATESIDEESIIRRMIGLEYEYEILRKAAVFSLSEESQ